MNSKLELQLREFLVKNVLFVEEGYALDANASFVTEGVIDSLGVTELADYVRGQYGFDVPLRDITPANFDSIAGLAAYIRRRLAEVPNVRPESLAGAQLASVSDVPGIQTYACQATGLCRPS